MRNKKPLHKTGTTRAKGRYHDLAKLQRAVQEACWEELRQRLGHGAWEKNMACLRPFVSEPDALEQSARNLFARLRSLILDVVAVERVCRREQQRTVEEIAASPTWEWTTPPKGGECARYLSQQVAPVLMPFLQYHKMGVSPEWLASLDDHQDYENIRRASENLKKRSPNWGHKAPRSRLVDVLEELNILDLPSHSSGELRSSSRFFTEREYALISLVLDVGVLSSPKQNKLKSSGYTVAEVIQEETKHMQLALRRISRWERRAEGERARFRARWEQEKRPPTPEEAARLAQISGPWRGPPPES